MKNNYNSFRLQLIAMSAFILFATTTVFANEQSIVTAIAEDANSTWVGTHQGLWKISKSNNHKEHYTKENSQLPSNYVNAIAIEADGNVWIGTSNGILRYDRFAFFVLNSSNSSLPDNHITSIVCTANQNIIIGTFYEGLVVKVHNGRFVHYSTSNCPLINNCILSISVDANDNIWVGHLNSGVTKLDAQNKWSVFNDENGFFEKDICFVTSSDEKTCFYTYHGKEIVIENGQSKTIDNSLFNGNQLLVYFTKEDERSWVYYHGEKGVVSINNNNQTNYRLNEKVKNNFFLSNTGIRIFPDNELVVK